MQFIHSQQQLKAQQRGCVATIGNFDGVHRGHVALIEQLHALSARLNLPTQIILFEPQPREYFMPEAAPGRLLRLRDKLDLLRAHAIERVLCLRFNAEFAAMPAQRFIDDLLIDKLALRHLVVGRDFRFGHKRMGDYQLLQQVSQSGAFALSVTPDVCIGERRISSTWCREALAQGDFTKVAELLGRPFRLNGRVAYGAQLARNWGVPTANIPLHRLSSPLTGIFTVHVHGVADKPWPGVAYLGRRPNLQDARQMLEVHLFDFADNLYGRRLSVEFLQKIRDEQKITDAAAMRQQVLDDVAQAKALLK